MEKFTVPGASDGVQLSTLVIAPESPKAVVQFVHGMAEHKERYYPLMTYLSEMGYACLVTDLRGHGATVTTPDDLGYFGKEGWKGLIQDTKSIVSYARRQFPGMKIFLLGHSMGSFMARSYIGEYPDDFDLCILSGTGHTPGIVCAAGKAMAKSEIKKHGSKYRSPKLQDLAFGSYLKGIEDPIGANDWICRDEAVIRAYDADPLCGFPGTAGLMYDMMTGLSLIGSSSHIAKMKKDLPVLFIAGEADPVGGWGKTVRQVESRFRAAGMRDVSAVYYPGMRHEVLNEIGKEQVWQDVLGWITEHI